MTERSPYAVIRDVLKLSKGLNGHLVLSVVTAVLANIANVAIMLFGSFAVLDVLGYDTYLPMEMNLVAMGASVLVRSLTVYIHRNRESYYSSRSLLIIRDKVFRAVRRLCPAKLEGRDKGDLINVMTADMQLIENLYTDAVIPISIAVLFGMIMVAGFCYINLILGVLALVAYVFMSVFIPYLVSMFGADDGNEFRRQSGELASYILDSLRGIREVQQYEYGEAKLSGIGIRSRRLAKVEDNIKTVEGSNRSISTSSILILDMIFIMVTIMLYREGSIALDMVMVAIVALMGSFGPFLRLSKLGSRMKSPIAAGRRILDLLEEEPQTEDVIDKPDVTFDGLEVKKVSFSYENVEVLKGASMEVAKGEVLGIVGGNGSGKTTLLKLIMRFWDPDEGKIKFGPRDIDYINTKDLREIEGYVTQDSQIFHDTIRNNLLIAKADATDEEIMEACRKASLHDFIMTLPEGYDTVVGEMGDTLSSGERRRLSLARAFLHDSELMLLDEPTANLDVLNEAVVIRSLNESREGRTMIIVSHSESTLRTADRIIRIEDGKID